MYRRLGVRRPGRAECAQPTRPESIRRPEVGALNSASFGQEAYKQIGPLCLAAGACLLLQAGRRKTWLRRQEEHPKLPGQARKSSGRPVCNVRRPNIDRQLASRAAYGQLLARATHARPWAPEVRQRT